MSKIYSVFDAKVQAYMQPFFARTPGEAIRMFTEVASDQATLVAKHPTDFHLFEVGEFDETTGELHGHEPSGLGSAASYVNQQETEK